MGRPRVLLADDHASFLALAVGLFEPEYEVVKTVRDGQTLIDEAVRLEPDLLVLDISMPVLNGIEAAQKLRAAGCRAKVVFLTMHGDLDYVRAALAAGAVGYVVKGRMASDLLPALRAARAGRSFISPSLCLNHEG